MAPSPALSVPLLAFLAPFAAAQNCFSAPPPGIALGNGTDIVLPMQPIGFPFPLAGSTFTDIHISDHGIAFLSNGGVPAPPASADPLLYSPSGANLVAGSPMIAALWTDVVAGGASAQIWLDSQPTRCTVTWADVAIFGMPQPTFDLQLHLYPGGAVEFAFGVGATNNSGFGGGAEFGVCGVSLGGGAVLPASADLSAGGSVATDTVFEEWLVPGAFDLAATGLRLVPTSPGWQIVPLGAPTGCASAYDYGAGCGADFDSVYEAFVGGAFDLGGRTVTFQRTLAGYSITSGAGGTIVPPGPFALPVAAGLQDGQEQFLLPVPMPIPGGTTDLLNITTKGQIELDGVPGIVNYQPTVADLLAWPNTAFHCWHDFDQTVPGSGGITFEEASGIVYVTWNGVHSFQFAVPSSIQFQLDLYTGDVTLVCGPAPGLADPLNPNGCVVGYSVGGVSADPGAADFATLAAAIAVADFGGFPLALSTEGLPYLGNAAFGVRVSFVPALAPLAFVFYGDVPVDPGVGLGFAGLTGCSAHTNANLGSATVVVSAGTGVAAIPIPSSPGLLGAAASAQAVALSPATPAGLITSNGSWFVVGN